MDAFQNIFPLEERNGNKSVVHITYIGSEVIYIHIKMLKDGQKDKPLNRSCEQFLNL